MPMSRCYYRRRRYFPFSVFWPCGDDFDVAPFLRDISRASPVSLKNSALRTIGYDVTVSRTVCVRALGTLGEGTVLEKLLAVVTGVAFQPMDSDIGMARPGERQ